ncbi:hypothetical protein CCR83_05740 [Rhodobacter veldkampii DSM 11550]|uniref:UDP-phosphate N-acetylglucosaminyl 1-phosphate transferase n=1 Tax=Phaeovulum veldkampii DSM 11550 TaxID=1185920 RepID=A0A2T4JLX5_9RHOB|nr:glycosyltransferase [Phaeovulum veldkampii]MBK5945966.1 hypothetical protein [Phaeovulum veldkampii DSM 11550]PTE18911.1 hypothetical protein C5F46_01740 [Phaeovulum veldkampii DSM 11550]TDQ64639.1 UDP-N-acetylmuramyl pentapeptide phosphotransferase/UDP-N-acetylglucosamine-1-phosphate transferase [Phaeovulum veldkampii DSM 11550]
MIDLPLIIDALAVFSISFLVCATVLATRGLHLPFAHRRADTRAVQAAHRVPTPRLGGLALFAGLLCVAVLAPPSLSDSFMTFAIAMLPVFLAGLLEDLGRRISPLGRLLAAAASSGLVIWFLGVWLTRLDVPGIDFLMAFAPFAILFTVFAVVGVCHAFNLIDGLNGLASGAGVLTALGLAAVALRAGDPALAEVGLMIVAALIGFLVFNFPAGRIFLGDAGAYSLGHILAWLSIGLMVHHTDVSPWAMLLIFFWPVADTFFAIWRRQRAGRPTGQPDRLHFHQLVMRAIEILVLGRNVRHVANPLSTAVMLPMIAAPVIAGVLLWNAPLLACLAMIAFGALFVGSYMLGMELAARRVRVPVMHRRAPAPTMRIEVAE